MQRWIYFHLVFFLLSNPVRAFPSGDRQISACSRLQCSDSDKFKYEIGRSYSYRYSAEVATYVNGTDSKQSRLHLTAKVYLDVKSKCDFTLRLSDVSLKDSELADEQQKTEVHGEAGFRKPLESFDLKFAFHDGDISHICPQDSDPVWSVNIKRGVLSALQNTMPRFDLPHQTVETDVTGTCRVKYSFDDIIQNSMTVIKSRDLQSCSSRYGQLSAFSGVAYNFPGKHPSALWTDSKSQCVQTITSRRITNVECTESHGIRPFSNGSGSGAVTTVRQVLSSFDSGSEARELKTEDFEDFDSSTWFERSASEDDKKSDLADREMPPRTTLLFQHVAPSQIESYGIDAVKTLQQLCQLAEYGINMDTANLYGRFVDSLRVLDYPTLNGLLDESGLCREGKATRFMLDGLISAGTSAAVAVMRDQVGSGTVDQLLVNRWTASLAFIADPNEGHLEAALPLLDMQSSVRPHQVALSVSGLARKMCSSRDCGGNQEVTLLIGKLTRPLVNSCQTRSREEREEVILSLKSLANIGSAIKSGDLDTIESCFLERSNPSDVRVAALEALRSVPCKMKRDSALRVMKDASQDAEVRVVAYLMVMKCADYGVVTQVRDMLTVEEVNQVGSFVWTHLNNLARSSLPSKLGIQGLIANQQLVTKFDTDARKFSRNWETSFFFDQFNAAAGLESNIVFSPQSYIPRSTSLNLTVDLFGQSINLLEVDGRFRGFEGTVESLFGPGGIYHHNGIRSAFQNLRVKRKVPPPAYSGLNMHKFDAMSQHFNSSDDSSAPYSQSYPQMAFSLRVMGSEIRHDRWEGMEEMGETLRKWNPITKLQSLMSGETLLYNRASQLLDSSLVIPMAAGLPLNLTARANAVVEIRGDMRTDLRSLLSRGQGEINWNVHPSASVTFDGSMTVDAKVAKAGIKLTGTLHSSIATSGAFKVDGWKLVDLRVDLPQDRTEFINLKTELIMEHRRHKVPLNGMLEHRVESTDCTRGLTQRLLGLQICSKIFYPNASTVADAPSFPLTGPANLNLYLEKDGAVTAYRFLHKVENSQRKKSWNLIFQPEGARESKEVGIKAEIDFEDANIGLSLLFPHTNYNAKGTFKWTDAAKEVEATFMEETIKVFSGRASLIRTARNKLQVLQPKLLLTYSNQNVANLNGEVKWTEKKGTLQYDTNLDLKVGSLSCQVKGYSLVDDRTHASNLTLEYKWAPNARPEKLKAEVKLTNGTGRSARFYTVNWDVQSTAHPLSNTMGSWSMQRGQGLVDHQLTVTAGSQLDPPSTLTVKQGFSFSRSPTLSRALNGHFQVSLPSKGLDLALVVGHHQSDMMSDTHFLGRYAPGKELESGLMVHLKPGVMFQTDASFNMSLPSQPVVKMSGKVQETSRHNYKIVGRGVWGVDTDFQLDGTYALQSKGHQLERDFSLELSGANIHRTTLTYSLATNTTTFKTHVQSSYGEDSLSLFLMQDQLSARETKWESKIGYLNYLHSIDMYWNADPAHRKGIVDVHVNKVLDIHGEFARDLEENGRRATSLELYWDKNRDPNQKVALQTVLEPSDRNSDDWNGSARLIYPGAAISSNFGTITLRNSRSVVATVDLGDERLINITARAYRNQTGFHAEFLVNTPFDGWQLNRAHFHTRTAGLSHSTDLQMNWGPKQFLELGIGAKVESKEESKLVEGVIFMKSSVEQLEHVQGLIRSELMPDILNSSIKIQWRKNAELAMESWAEWNFDEQARMKLELAMVTPSMNMAKLQLFHDTQWTVSQYSETSGNLQIDKSNYGFLLKGENPTDSRRFEVTGQLTTPHEEYEKLGFSSVCVADEQRPVVDLQINWPSKQVGLNFEAEISGDPEAKSSAQLRLLTPYPQLKEILLTGGCLLTSPTDFEIELGSRWGEEQSVTLNTSLAFESETNFRLMAELRTPFEWLEKYGIHSGLHYNPDTPDCDALVKLVLPSKELGFSWNSTTNHVSDDDSAMSASASLQLGNSPELRMDLSYARNVTSAQSLSFAVTRSTDSASLDLDTYLTDEGRRIVQVGVTTPYGSLSRVEYLLRYLPEYFEGGGSELYVANNLKWRHYLEEHMVGGMVKYSSVEEELEDLTMKTTTKGDVELRASPWQFRAGVGGKLVFANSQIQPEMNVVLNGESVSVVGSVDMIESQSSMVATRKSPRLQAPQVFRMNSTWMILDDISVEGTVETPFPGIRTIPWKIVYRAKDKETEENFDYGNEDYPQDEPPPDETPPEESLHDWEREIRFEAKITKNNFLVLNLLAVPGKVTADLSTPFDSMKRSDLVADYTMTEEVISWKAEIKSDDRIIETSGSWNAQNYYPLELLLTVSDPGGQQMAFQSKMEPRETGTKVSVSLDSVGAEYRLDFDYELVMIERASLNLKIVTPVRNHELYAVDFNIRGDNGGGSAQFSLESPLRGLNKVKLSAEWSVDVQLYKLSGKLDTDSASGKFRAGFVGDDGEMRINFLLEATDLCLYSADVASDAEFNSLSTSLAARWNGEYDYAIDSKLNREQFSKVDWNFDLKSMAEAESRWNVHFDLDIRDLSTVYSHNLSYHIVHDDLLYRCYGRMFQERNKRAGKVGVQWAAGKPLEVDFTFNTLSRRMGEAKVTLMTPWREEASLTAHVNVDARHDPKQFKIRLEALDKKLTSDIDIEFQDSVNVAGHVVVNTALDWLPMTSLDFSTKSTSDSINGTYVVRWNEDKMAALSVFRRQTTGVDIQRKDIYESYQVKSSWTYLPEASLHYSTEAKKPTVRESVIRVGHNSTELVNVVFVATDSSSAGQETNERQLEFRSVFFSTGMAYSRVFEYSGGDEGSNLPNTITRTAELFKVDRRPEFLFRTQVVEKTTVTGEEIVIRLSNPRRTIEFKTLYDFPENTFRHGSEFRWHSDAKSRIAYEIEIGNTTTNSALGYVMTTSIFTPVRDIGLTGLLQRSQKNVRIVAEIVWDLSRRESVAKVTYVWDDVTKASSGVRSDRVKLSLAQGNLPNELAVVSDIQRSPSEPLSIRSEIKYSDDPRCNVLVRYRLATHPGNWNADLNVTHPASELTISQTMSCSWNASGIRTSHEFLHLHGEPGGFKTSHLAFVDVERRELYVSATSSSLDLLHQGKVTGSGGKYKLSYEMEYDDNPPKRVDVDVDADLPLVHLMARSDPQNRNGLHFRAGVPDQRHAVLEVSDTEDSIHSPLFEFVFRLNHSKLITSRAHWRTDLGSELRNRWQQARHSAALTAEQLANAYVVDAWTRADESFRKIAADVRTVLWMTVENFEKESGLLMEDVHRLKQNVFDGYNSNAFFAKTIYEIGGALIRQIPFGSYAQNVVESIESTGDRLLKPITGEPDTFSRALSRTREFFRLISDQVARWFGRNWHWPAEQSSRIVEELSGIFVRLGQEFDRFNRELQEQLGDIFHDIGVRFRRYLTDSWAGIYQVVRPVFLRTIVTVESALWKIVKDVLDYFYEQRDAVVESSYFQKMSRLVEDVTQFYRDMQSIDWPSNVPKYLTKSRAFLQQKYADIDEYVLIVEKVRVQLLDWYATLLMSNPEYQKIADTWNKFVSLAEWSLEHLQVGRQLKLLVAHVRERALEEFRQTATEARMHYQLDKTLLRFNPELGLIELEQKLPFSWISFDERPRFEELPELRRVQSVLNLFRSSNGSWIDQLMSYVPEQDLADWLPPFRSSAQFIGLQHYVTLNGVHYEFIGPCTYLLAHDFRTHNFTLAVQYVSTRGKPYASVLQLVVDEAQWDLDLSNRTLRVAGNSRMLPTEERGTVAYYGSGRFVIHSPARGFRLDCVAAYEVCTLTLSGWYHDKVAGMFGRMDNEPTTDLLSLDGTENADLKTLAQSWDVTPGGKCKTPENLARKPQAPEEQLLEACSSFFSNSRSTLRACFATVDPMPYWHMCSSKSRKLFAPDGCYAAAAYVEACATKGIRVRIPSPCVRCQLDAHVALEEGETRQVVPEKNSRHSTDVVVVVELKKCNDNSKMRQSLTAALGNLDKELNAHKIVKNRYAFVVFGGHEPFDAPTVRTVNGNVFVTVKEVEKALHHLPHGDGTKDVLGAVKLATQLNFRPEASKTIILLPCSSCDSGPQRLEYRRMAQDLLEQDVTLHILSDQEFRFSKSNVNKQFLGLDSTNGYTSKDSKGRVVGDPDLRRQAKLSKNALGVCASLALQSNGTIFAASKMRESRKAGGSSSDAKRATSVWVKRIASTAAPSTCHSCTCNVVNYSHSWADCRVCNPVPPQTVDMTFMVDDADLPRTGRGAKHQRTRDEAAASKEETEEKSDDDK